jgi:D-serine deaminase-like pyridoxal phosphate-dependent protein
MAQAGMQDIFIPYNIIGQAKLERLMRLNQQAKISVTVDSEYVVRGLSESAHKASTELSVLVECDTGAGRCGVQSPQQAADVACIIAQSPGLHFGGLMTYPNSPQTDPFVRETKNLLAAQGIPVERVSGGSTAGMWQAHTHQEITEHRAGMYIYGDRYTMKAGAITLDDCSFRVVATVVSRPTADRGIIDGGSKTFSSDLLGLEGYGLIVEYPEARFYALSEEHGHIDFAQCPRKPEIGERITVIPNHCCVVTNLFNEVIGVRKGTVEVVWPVACRGLVQ